MLQCNAVVCGLLKLANASRSRVAEKSCIHIKKSVNFVGINGKFPSGNRATNLSDQAALLLHLDSKPDFGLR